MNRSPGRPVAKQGAPVRQIFAEAVQHHQAGRFGNAIALYQMVLEREPGHAEAHSNLGIALQAQGRLEEAIACQRRAIAAKPAWADAHRNLGIVLEQQGQPDEAVACYRQAIKLRPSYAEAHGNLGRLLEELGQIEAAAASSRKATELKAKFPEAYSNLGSALLKLGRLREAVAACRRAIILKPDLLEAYNNLGRALGDQGQVQEALANYGKALAIKPNHFSVYSNLLFTKNYDPDHSPDDMRALAQRFGSLVSGSAKHPLTSWAGKASDQPLRVGVVSADLRNHAVGFFLDNVLRAINPNRIELLAFPSSGYEDELTIRIKPSFKAWLPIHLMGDEAAARMIHAHGVHVLLDLSGHTSGNRLPLFGWRPAPVQATWLGYFATTGVAEMDYIIGDPNLTPPAEASHFTEAAWPLPEIAYCFTPPPVNVAVSGLPAHLCGRLTFGCFSNLTKVSDDVIAVWARVLGAVPGSRMMLKTKQFRDAAMRDDIAKRFAAQGITGDRLLIEPPSDRADYLRAYHQVDMMLDTFPYPGGTTSAEALWMGVPVLTKRGDRFLSHFGETIARNAGLPDWIATTDDEYVAKAVQFSSDLDRLASFRARLRGQVLASPLFDAPRFARHFEDAMEGMWNRSRGRGAKLNLGCGFDKRAGFVNVDKCAAVAPDIVWDMEFLPVAVREQLRRRDRSVSLLGAHGGDRRCVLGHHERAVPDRQTGCQNPCYVLSSARQQFYERSDMRPCDQSGDLVSVLKNAKPSGAGVGLADTAAGDADRC